MALKRSISPIKMSVSYAFNIFVSIIYFYCYSSKNKYKLFKQKYSCGNLLEMYFCFISAEAAESIL